MKLTKQKIEQLIQEELETIMTEMEHSVEDELVQALKMKIWDEMGGQFAMQDQAMAQAQAQVQQMIAYEVDLEQVLASVQSEREAKIQSISKTRPYKRSFHGYDQSDSSGYTHPSRNEE